MNVGAANPHRIGPSAQCLPEALSAVAAAAFITLITSTDSRLPSRHSRLWSTVAKVSFVFPLSSCTCLRAAVRFQTRLTNGKRGFYEAPSWSWKSRGQMKLNCAARECLRDVDFIWASNAPLVGLLERVSFSIDSRGLLRNLAIASIV